MAHEGVAIVNHMSSTLYWIWCDTEQSEVMLFQDSKYAFERRYNYITYN